MLKTKEDEERQIWRDKHRPERIIKCYCGNEFPIRKIDEGCTLMMSDAVMSFEGTCSCGLFWRLCGAGSKDVDRVKDWSERLGEKE